MIERGEIRTELLGHDRINLPAYILWITDRPSSKGRGKNIYQNALRQAAREQVHAPIKTEDIEIEIYYATSRKINLRCDIDNIIKPALDALKGIAYVDDAQVRSVAAKLFDHTKKHDISGRVEIISRLLGFMGENITCVAIYSDSRILEIGRTVVAEQRYREWEEFLKTHALSSSVVPLDFARQLFDNKLVRGVSDRQISNWNSKKTNE